MVPGWDAARFCFVCQLPVRTGMTDPLAGRQIGAWCLTFRHGNNTGEFSTLDYNWTVSKTESCTAYSYYRTGENDKITNLYCYTRKLQHTSWGSCFTTVTFSCLTWADKSPLSRSVVQGPSVLLLSGTISMYSSLQESSFTLTSGLVDLVVSSFESASVNIVDCWNIHTQSYTRYHVENKAVPRVQNMRTISTLVLTLTLILARP